MTKAKVTFPSAPDTSAIDVQDEGSVIVSNPTALNFTGPGVTVTENPSGTAEVDIPGLQYWTESEDAATQQSTIFTPNNSATDVNAVLLPKGNGANLAQTPDGTNTGGNARGIYATDWQKSRDSVTKVASGAYSTIIGGQNNSASGNSAVSGGSGSAATGNDSFAMIIATSSGYRSAAIGTNALSSGNYSAAIGGLDARATANYSKASGYRGTAYQQFMQTFGLSQNVTQSQLQTSEVGLIVPGPDLVFTTGETKNVSSLNPPDSNRAYNIVASWTAVVVSISGTATGVSVGDYMTQCNLFGFKRVAGTGSITSITTVATHGDASMTGTASVGYSVSSNNLLTQFTAPTFIGGGSLTIRILIDLKLVEVAWT